MSGRGPTGSLLQLGSTSDRPTVGPAHVPGAPACDRREAVTVRVRRIEASVAREACEEASGAGSGAVCRRFFFCRRRAPHRAPGAARRSRPGRPLPIVSLVTWCALTRVGCGRACGLECRRLLQLAADPADFGDSDLSHADPCPGRVHGPDGSARAPLHASIGRTSHSVANGTCDVVGWAPRRAPGAVRALAQCMRPV